LPGRIDESILELWSDFRDVDIRDRVLDCASALAGRDFFVLPIPTASEANRCILSQVPLHKTVLYWPAATLEEMGIVSTLQARGNSVRSALPMVTGRTSFRRTRMPARSIYLSTVGAVTMDGVLVKVEPELIGLFGPGRAPDSLVLVAGYNHIVDGLEEALRRVKDICFPACARRMALDIECARTERCIECEAPVPMCAVNTIVTRKPLSPDITVVLIGEKLGR
jgi:hypothetical protein